MSKELSTVPNSPFPLESSRTSLFLRYLRCQDSFEYLLNQLMSENQGRVPSDWSSLSQSAFPLHLFSSSSIIFFTFTPFLRSTLRASLIDNSWKLLIIYKMSSVVIFLLPVLQSDFQGQCLECSSSNLKLFQDLEEKPHPISGSSVIEIKT